MIAKIVKDYMLDNSGVSFEEFVMRKQNEQSRKQISSLLKQYYANPQKRKNSGTKKKEA